MNPIKSICFLLLIIIAFQDLTSQETKKDLESITRDEILRMTYDELLAMPFEDLLMLAGKLGVSIDELLKMQTSVASRTELSPRESPGILSIVTEEEIRHSGASDLIDVLKLVPGFDFEYDVDGVIGIGFRGNWVHEGKALIMLDGQMMNDLVYFNTPFGNHFDVSQIKKIEIVRGPGSAIYGGNSELCVINIITKNGKDINGISAGITYGQLPGNYGRMNGSLQAGVNAGKWDLALKTFVGQANRSTGTFVEGMNTVSGDFVKHDLSKNGSKIETQNINLSAQRDNFTFRFVYDQYNTQTISDSIPAFNNFRNITSCLQYDFDISDKFSVTPVLSYQFSNPYENSYLSSYSYHIHRYKAGVGINYDPSKKINIIAGGELYRDNGQIREEELGSYVLNLDNMALYTQLLWKMSGFNVVVGGRAEKSSNYGSAFAPRIGITRIIKNFHFKVLASEAFRSPSIGNIDVSDRLKVEQTFVIETELGYKINDNMFATANIYDINVNNPILYWDDGNSASIPKINWGYYNEKKMGSNGIELEYRYKYFWGYSTVNYSYYTNKWKSVPEYYNAIGHKSSILGMPQHKISYLASFKLNSRLNLTPSIIYSSNRHGYGLDAEGNFIVKDFDPSLMVNINMSVNDFLVRKLNLDFGVTNILDNEAPYLQPYNGGYPPFPGRGREFVAKLMYNFNLSR